MEARTCVMFRANLAKLFERVNLDYDISVKNMFTLTNRSKIDERFLPAWDEH